MAGMRFIAALVLAAFASACTPAVMVPATDPHEVPDFTPKPDEHHGLSGPAIAGIAVGSTAGVVLTALVVMSAASLNGISSSWRSFGSGGL